MQYTIVGDVMQALKLELQLFGGEGLFLATLQGPGRLILQTLPFSRLADRIRSAMGGGAGQSQGLGGIGGVFKDVISGE